MPIDLTTFAGLQAAHAHVQMGSYFARDDDLGEGVRYLASDLITDSYWNYAYGLTGDVRDLAKQLAAVRQHAQSIERPAAIALDRKAPVALLDAVSGGSTASTEVWMTLGAPPKAVPPRPTGYEQRLVANQDDFERFLDVFKDAYGEGEPGEPGYADLPEAYPESLRQAKPTASVHVAHVLGYLKAEPAAIASVYVSDEGYAGLYNVGTAKAARRQGLGTLASHAAILRARELGASTVLLQTEPESEVEDLYLKLGFAPQMVCALIELDGP